MVQESGIEKKTITNPQAGGAVDHLAPRRLSFTTTTTTTLHVSNPALVETTSSQTIRTNPIRIWEVFDDTVGERVNC